MFTSLLLAATTSLITGAAPAGAATDPNCTGYGSDNLVDPVGPEYSAAYIKNRTTGTIVGSIQLCERWDAASATFIRWGAVTLYYDMSTGQHANGRITSRIPQVASEQKLCSDPGGTGAIIGGTGDRTCATGGFQPESIAEQRADAYVYDANGNMIAYGATLWYGSRVN